MTLASANKIFGLSFSSLQAWRFSSLGSCSLFRTFEPDGIKERRFRVYRKRLRWPHRITVQGLSRRKHQSLPLPNDTQRLLEIDHLSFPSLHKSHHRSIESFEPSTRRHPC